MGRKEEGGGGGGRKKGERRAGRKLFHKIREGLFCGVQTLPTTTTIPPICCHMYKTFHFQFPYQLLMQWKLPDINTH